MTASLGGFSTSVIAAIAVAGIGGLLALITITAFLCDLPKRLRRRKAARQGGTMSPSMDEKDADVEKNEPTVAVAEIKSQDSKSTLATRPSSPLCQCEHPAIPPPSATESPASSRSATRSPVSPRLATHSPRLPSHTEHV